MVVRDCSDLISSQILNENLLSLRLSFITCNIHYASHIALQVDRHIYTHTCSIHKRSSLMVMVAIIHAKSYSHVPKHFQTHHRNLHVKLRCTFEAPCHKVFFKVVFQAAFQLPSFSSIVSLCKSELGEGVCLNQGKYYNIH